MRISPLVVLSIFLAGVFTVVAYGYRSVFCTDPADNNTVPQANAFNQRRTADTVDRYLPQAKSVCGECKRYVTSDTFTLRSRFRQL